MAHLSQFLATVMPHVRIAELSQLLATVIPRCLHSGKSNEIFPLWERHGFHVMPVHFYQPIPDTQSLPETLWDLPGELVGIDMNDSGQFDLGIFQNSGTNMSRFRSNRPLTVAAFILITPCLGAPTPWWLTAWFANFSRARSSKSAVGCHPCSWPKPP